MRHRGDRLDRLAEAHLVAEDHPALRQREPGAEGLVAAQRHPPVCVVERLGADPFGHLVGKEALGRRRVGAATGDLGEQAVELGRAQLELDPRLGLVGRTAQQVDRGLREQFRYAARRGLLGQRRDLRDGAQRPLLRRPPANRIRTRLRAGAARVSSGPSAAPICSAAPTARRACGPAATSRAGR